MNIDLSSILTYLAVIYFIILIIKIVYGIWEHNVGNCVCLFCSCQLKTNIIDGNVGGKSSAASGTTRKRRNRAQRAHTDPLKGNINASAAVVEDRNDDGNTKIIYQLFCGKYITVKDSEKVMVGNNCTMNNHTIENDLELELADDSDSDDEEENEEDHSYESGCDTRFDEFLGPRKNSLENMQDQLSSSKQRSRKSSLACVLSAPKNQEEFTCAAGTFRFGTLPKSASSDQLESSFSSLPSQGHSASYANVQQQSYDDMSIKRRRRAEETISTKHDSDDECSKVQDDQADGGNVLPYADAATIRRVPSEEEMKEKKDQILRELEKLRHRRDSGDDGSPTRKKSGSTWKFYTRIKVPSRKKSK